MGIMLQTPRTLTKKTLGDRAFLAAAPKLWNGLPSQLRNEPNFNRFFLYRSIVFFYIIFLVILDNFLMLIIYFHVMRI